MTDHEVTREVTIWSSGSTPAVAAGKNGNHPQALLTYGLGPSKRTVHKEGFQALDHTTQFVFCIAAVLKHHNAPGRVVTSLRRQLIDYLVGSPSEQTFKSRAAYVTALPKSRFLSGPPPPAPDIVWSMSGQFRRWARARMVMSRKNLHLWSSFFFGKKACLPLSLEYVESVAIPEHRSALTTYSPIDPDFFGSLKAELRPVINMVREGMGTEFSQWPCETTGWDSGVECPSRKEYLLSAAPSTASLKACFENPRAAGGQVGALLDILFACHDAGTCDRRQVLRFCRKQAEANRWLKYLDDIINLNRDSDLISFRFHHQVIVDGVLKTNYLQPLRGFDCGQERRLIEILSRFDVPGSVIRAAVHGVVEPLKVRMITKGQAVPYFLAKPLQKAIWRAMRRISCFELIGRPVDVLDVMRVHDNPSPGDGLVYHSDDYKSATDGLKIELSEWIMAELVVGMSDFTRDIAVRVLGPHDLRYPDGVVRQRVGQLMGSVLSFPVLCLANLGVHLLSLTVNGDFRPLCEKLSGVLINGDDKLYRAPLSFGPVHDRVSSMAGLLPSIGKSYRNNRCANINSTDFFFDGHIVKRVPYLNIGLLFGQSKVMAVLDDSGCRVDSSRSICSTANELLSGSYSALRERSLWLDFFNYNREALVEEAGLRNFFVSQGFGGMGIRLPTNFRWKVSFGQTLLAYRLMGRMDGWPMRMRGRGVEFSDPVRLAVPGRRHFLCGDLEAAFGERDDDVQEVLGSSLKYFRLRRTEQDSALFREASRSLPRLLLARGFEICRA